MKATPKIVIENRGDDFMAFVEGNRAVWDCGKTQVEAIGRLIQTHGLVDVEWAPGRKGELTK